jgi:hypothetical protein
MVFPQQTYLCVVVAALSFGPTTFAQSNTNAPAKGEISSEKTLNLPGKVTTLINEAKLDLNAGRVEEAEGKLKEAISIDPRRRDAQYYLTLINERNSARSKAVLEPKFPVIKKIDGTLHFGVPVDVHNRPLREVADDVGAK